MGRVSRRRVAASVSAGLLALALGCAHAPSRKDRESSEIHYQLGAEALQAGRREDALREFDEALRFDDHDAVAHLGKGLALQVFGRVQDAEREYRRPIELKPDLSDAHNALGQLLATTGRLEEAVHEFDLALGNMLYREAYVARCNKGQALYQLGRRDEGLAELKACVAQAPRYCHGQRELGSVQLEAGRIKEAIEAFGRYAESCDKLPDAWYQLGLARMKAGDRDGAREAFGKCQGIGGDDPVVEECRLKVRALQ